LPEERFQRAVELGVKKNREIIIMQEKVSAAAGIPR
jgi:hypothetical protein